MNNIDVRRSEEVLRINKDNMGWLVCNEYTKNLNKIINKCNINILFENLYNKYLLNLKSNNLEYKNKNM